MSATRFRAQPGTKRKSDSLRSLRAGAVWTGLPLRERHLLVWLLTGDILTADLASLLVYGQLRTAQRRLRRLVSIGLLHGFWSASAHRPRGRYAYVLTPSARTDIEALVWPEGRPDRPVSAPSSAPIHQLATLDLLAAFLRQSASARSEGIVAWVPERACGWLFGGFLRPDALAIIRINDRLVALFVERDLGSERGEVLAEKLRRYWSMFGRESSIPLHVGFVVESERRARTVYAPTADAGRPMNPTILTAVGERLFRDPLGTRWSDGQRAQSIRELPSISSGQAVPILAPGCLGDGDASGAFDERGARLLPGLRPYLRL